MGSHSRVHNHSDHSLATILKLSEGAKGARKVVIIGSIINLALASMKLLTGYFGKSEALLADGVHSLGDFATDAIIFLFIGLSYRKPDKRFSYGYGKFETFATLIVGLLICQLGILLLVESAERISGFLKGETLPRPDIWTVIVIIFAMCMKEGLYRFYSRSGRRLASTALKALGIHHRIDAMASIATLIGVTCAHFFGHSLSILDPCASIVISAFIIISSASLFIPALGQLVEHSLPEKVFSECSQLLENTPDVKGIEYMRGRSNGRTMVIDLGIKVDSSRTTEINAILRKEITELLSKRLSSDLLLSIAFYPA